MDDQQFWDMAFAAVCSLRFHPRNDEFNEMADDEVSFAADIADLMIRERRKRCQDGLQL